MVVRVCVRVCVFIRVLGMTSVVVVEVKPSIEMRIVSAIDNVCFVFGKDEVPAMLQGMSFPLIKPGQLLNSYQGRWIALMLRWAPVSGSAERTTFAEIIGTFGSFVTFCWLELDRQLTRQRGGGGGNEGAVLLYPYAMEMGMVRESVRAAEKQQNDSALGKNLQERALMQFYSKETGDALFTLMSVLVPRGNVGSVDRDALERVASLLVKFVLLKCGLQSDRAALDTADFVPLLKFVLLLEAFLQIPSRLGKIKTQGAAATKEFYEMFDVERGVGSDAIVAVLRDAVVTSVIQSAFEETAKSVKRDSVFYRLLHSDDVVDEEVTATAMSE
jgi:hypothetical protein